MELQKYPRLGQYLLLSTLGEGQFAKVKLVQDSKTGKKYAAKIHKSEQDGCTLDDDTIESIKNEIHAITKLQHPNIIKIVDFIEKDNIVDTKGKKKPV